MTRYHQLDDGSFIEYTKEGNKPISKDIVTKARRKELKPLAKFFLSIGAAKVHIDGDGIGVVWRWWHPFTWLVFVYAAFLCAFIERDATVFDAVPMKLSKYWLKPENQKRIAWL